MSYCPKCRAKLRPNAKFCHHCGMEATPYPKADITPPKAKVEKKIRNEKPVLNAQEEKRRKKMREKGNGFLMGGKMKRTTWLFILIILFLGIVFALWSLFSPLSPANIYFILIFVIFNLFILQAVCWVLIVIAIMERRRERQWNKGAKLKLVLGVLAVIVLVVPGVSIWTYQSGCVERLGPGAILVGCHFTEMDLSGMDLHGAHLSRARLDNTILHQTDFSDADLSRANLKGADLSEAILRRANLDYADLNHADLSNAILEQATLTHAELNNANLSGTVLTGAVLEDCNLQNVIGLTDDFLADVLGVSDELLAWRLSQKKIRLESRESILQSLECVCRGTGITECANYTADESFHPLVLLNSVGGRHRWTDQIPEVWEPMALRFCELVVSVVKEEKVLVETCPYLLGPSIERYQYQMQVRVFAASTGAVVAEHFVQGPPPEDCPSSAPRDQTLIEGDHVRFSDLQAWLEENIVKMGA